LPGEARELVLKKKIWRKGRELLHVDSLALMSLIFLFAHLIYTLYC